MICTDPHRPHTLYSNGERVPNIISVVEKEDARLVLPHSQHAAATGMNVPDGRRCERCVAGSGLPDEDGETTTVPVAPPRGRRGETIRVRNYERSRRTVKPSPRWRQRGAPHTDYLDSLIGRLLEREVARLPSDARVIDVGAGESPPFRDRMPGWRFVDCDVGSGSCRAVAEALPFRGGGFDGSVSFAVLEHLGDPATALREAARVTRPDGFLVLITHGAYPYHPTPDDYWRWTAAGLRQLIGKEFRVERIVPVGGVLLSLCVLAGFYVDAMSRRLRVLRAVTRLLNLLARAFDRFTIRMDGGEERWGALSVGYLVVARTHRRGD